MLEHKTLPLLLLALGIVSVGCHIESSGGADPVGEEGGGGAAGDGEGGADPTGAEGGGGAAGDGQGSVPQHVDLFACNVPLTCEKIYSHIDTEPQSALNCAAELVLAGQPGAVQDLDYTGPLVSETERLTVFLGDGTALVQSRHRECLDPDACPYPVRGEPYHIPWTLFAHQICDVVINDYTIDGCARGDMGYCIWLPGSLTNCTDVEDRQCAEVTGLLD
ncbi:hypothetical protein [Sorangium sp. So ce131]|uniref:hypothetical protein n=1 Tax=Sorangium sp. So ce131 TaxID=3133282 RepID=UPI003F5E3C14